MQVGTAEAFLEGASAAAARKQVAAQQQAEARKKRWRDWLHDSASRDQRGLYRWCRGEAPPDPLPIR
eukprot:4844710-Lingulodinium_polyedra.AAC.1